MDGSSPGDPRKLTPKGGHKGRVGKFARSAEHLSENNGNRLVNNMESINAWGPKELIIQCREESAKNLATLIELRDDKETPAAVRALTVEMIWNRAFGKAPQMIAIADVTPDKGLDVSCLSDEELILLEKLIRKASPDTINHQATSQLVDQSALLDATLSEDASGD